MENFKEITLTDGRIAKVIKGTGNTLRLASREMGKSTGNGSEADMMYIMASKCTLIDGLPLSMHDFTELPLEDAMTIHATFMSVNFPKALADSAVELSASEA